jgi:hypothetical protein
MGAACTRPSLRPLFSEGERIEKLGRNMRREKENAHAVVMPGAGAALRRLS